MVVVVVVVVVMIVAYNEINNKVSIAQSEKDGDLQQKLAAIKTAEEEDFGQSRVGQVRGWLWRTLEYPHTSNTAQILAWTSLSMVLLSTFTFIVSTAEVLQEDADNESVKFVVFLIDVIENIVVSFFLVEYLVRLITSPRKLTFFFNIMNLIDFFALIPFFLSILLDGLEDFEIVGKTGKIIRLIRVMRILRIFKLVRHFAGLQSLFYTLKQAYKELGLLIILVIVGILLYSNLVYFCEREVYHVEGINCTDWQRSVAKGDQQYTLIVFSLRVLIMNIFPNKIMTTFSGYCRKLDCCGRSSLLRLDLHGILLVGFDDYDHCGIRSLPKSINILTTK